MGRQIPAKTWLRYDKLRAQGISRRQACKDVGISLSSAADYDNGHLKTAAVERIDRLKVMIAKEGDSQGVVPPKKLEELSSEAEKAIFDFEYFRKRYLGRETKPWQTMAAELVLELEATEDREWVVVNVPPGSGKSTTFTHDIPAWLIVRNRVLGKDIRIMIGSRTQRQANQYGRRLRATLMRNRPVEGAEASLLADFGHFEPVNKNLWRAEEFIIWENPDEQPTDEKEPTVMCAGMDTGFLGGRFSHVIWDDLVDASTLNTDYAREKQRSWYDDEAETRLEPGGVLLLQGQRLSGDDLYRYALDKPGVFENGEPDPDHQKYRHVVYPAHDESKCEENHGKDAPAWPEGCLLDPVRLSYRDLMTVKHNNPRKFDIIMQQKDVDPAGSLVPRQFIEGGEWNGIDLPGCLDRSRSLLQWPEGKELSDHLISAISVDPSPTKFWGIQWWIYDPSTEYRYLMDLHRAAMDAPDFLDRLQDGRYVGIAEEWVARAHDMGFPVNTVIVEQNAAQRFLLQYEYVKDWTALHGLSMIPHNTTHSNKADEHFGVQTLRPHYRFGRIRLPYGDAYTKAIVDQLIDEVVVWPEGRTDDQVMSQWMFEWNLPNLTSAMDRAPTKKSNVPSWLRKKAS